jgi:hypothetical protein
MLLYLEALFSILVCLNLMHMGVVEMIRWSFRVIGLILKSSSTTSSQIGAMMSKNDSVIGKD